MSSVVQGASASKPTRSSRKNASSATPVQDSSPNNHNSEEDEATSPDDQGEIKQEKGPTEKRPSKRRKVNHACVYCRRSHMTCDQGRPCSRCIKRNIPHLCHDEPRESKKGQDEAERSHGQDPYSPNNHSEDPVGSHSNVGILQPGQQPQRMGQEPMLPSAGPVTSEINNQSVERGAQAQNLVGNQLLFNDLNNIPQEQLQGIHGQALASMFNNQELNQEYNLLNSFLASSLIDDEAFYQGDNLQHQFSDPSFTNIMGPMSTSVTPMMPNNALYSQTDSAASKINGSTKKPSSKRHKEMEKEERYYLTAADPAGVEDSESRINKVLKAKYESGLLKPFNYVKGYTKLNEYMENNVHARSRQKILAQLQAFRPKFRERMQSLTDIELVLVEFWFERKLLEYDRVFASMAIPACCWRRTGEIFRGNRAMAELIGVPVERLRDGNIALHEIIVEESLVAYWQKFGSIAFDDSQKGIMTSCGLKKPGEVGNKETEIKCCFSFMIQRDLHSIPSLIIGNFLPVTQGKA